MSQCEGCIEALSLAMGESSPSSNTMCPVHPRISPQTGPRSVQPFLQGADMWQIGRHIMLPSAYRLMHSLQPKNDSKALTAQQRVISFLGTKSLRQTLSDRHKIVGFLIRLESRGKSFVWFHAQCLLNLHYSTAEVQRQQTLLKI